MCGSRDVGLCFWIPAEEEEEEEPGYKTAGIQKDIILQKKKKKKKKPGYKTKPYIPATAHTPATDREVVTNIRSLYLLLKCLKLEKNLKLTNGMHVM